MSHRSILAVAALFAAAMPVFAADPTAPPGNAASEGLLSRWLDVNDLSFGMRYRNTVDSNNATLFDFGQQRSIADGALKLDREGKYAVHFHVSSGKYFNWAYSSVIGGSFADTAAASLTKATPAEAAFIGATISKDPFLQTISTHIGERGWEMYVRQLYFSASPIRQLTFEYGGLGIERGVNTEITTYDNDGYMVGGRVRLKDPAHFYFDQIAFTAGYLGDIYFPSVFDRSQDFTRTNYQQYLVSKKFARRVDSSVDFTQHLGTHTWREAARVAVPESKIFNAIRAELYQRTNPIVLNTFNFSGGLGFALVAEKKLNKVNLEGGFASVDRNYPVYTGSAFMVAVGHPMNGDAYATGNRFFVRANYRPVPYLNFMSYYSHIIDTTFETLNAQSVQAGVDLDLKALIGNKFRLF